MALEIIGGFGKCAKCGSLQTLDHFPRRTGYPDQRYTACKPCRNIVGRVACRKYYGKNTKEILTQKRHALMTRYGTVNNLYNKVLLKKDYYFEAT